MVERLAEQKLNLEDKVEDLQSAITDYDDMTSVNNAIIELANNKDRELNEQIDLRNAEVATAKIKIASLEQALSDSGTTMLKFRDLTRQLNDENARIREQLQTSSSVQTPLVAPVTVDFRLKIQDDKVVADRVDHKLQTINGKILGKKLDYISLFMPDLYSHNREETFIRTCLLPEEISMKIALIAEEVGQKFNVDGRIEEHFLNEISQHRCDQIVYALTFLFLAKNIENSDRDIDFAIRTASPEMFVVLGELEGQLDRQSGAIQYFIDLLKQSRLDESISLEYLEKSVAEMSDILTKLGALSANRRERWG